MESEIELNATDNGNIVISPRHLGDRMEIAAAHKRLLLMLPNANNMPVDVLWSLAQLAVAYRLDPFNGEIYAVAVGKEKVGEEWQDKYVVMIGIKGLRVLAHRQSHYTIAPVRVMEDEEVKKLRRESYEPEDIGVEVQLFRLDVAKECKHVGIPYYPTVGRGFWRRNARAIKDNRGNITGYKPDNIPETWTALEVAEKRAEKAAITKAFDLRLDPRLFADEDAFEGAMHQMAEERGRDTAITMRDDHVTQEENGDILYVKT